MQGSRHPMFNGRQATQGVPTCSFSLLSLEGIPHNKVFDKMADSCSRRRTEDTHSQTGHRGVVRMRMEPQLNSLCERCRWWVERVCGK